MHSRSNRTLHSRERYEETSGRAGNVEFSRLRCFPFGHSIHAGDEQVLLRRFGLLSSDDQLRNSSRQYSGEDGFIK